MRPFLIFIPYILIPFILTLIFKKTESKKIGWSYVVTGLLIVLYPFVIFWIDDLLNPPVDIPRCGNPQMGFLFGSLVVLFPISMILQLIFNKIFLNTKIK